MTIVRNVMLAVAVAGIAGDFALLLYFVWKLWDWEQR